jgi:hypothetical protein
MKKYQDLLISALRQVLYCILVPYYWLEMSVNPYVKTPRIPKICIIGSVALIALGYILAKIF